MALEILPSIDLRNGCVVRLQQGDYARQISYAVDPVSTAQNFRASGARWMHIVDLDGAKEGRPVQTSLIGEIARASGLFVEAGGGIRSGEDVRRMLEAGVSRVVVGTKAIEDWAWFEGLVGEEVFAGKLVLAIDAKEGLIATRGWTNTTGLSAVEVARRVSGWPVAALLYTDVAKDGMLSGPNFEQTLAVAEAGKTPVIASGGVGTIEHVRRLATLPVWGAIIGRSLYEGTVDLAEAVRVGAVGEGVKSEE
ncbi:MAG TPA: 1-(5-phosphoribosyl)-5-[(5-phosphoribosylamino)methylideneamino]imidazole-4-carboxamide isomerase [Tepidisphaeraceae bacterium]|nr:1-(5-phosphoribosyl)-5-[(5-phosphoribosylamino)methylideneamino]imidazole-4-carboxamide isomerase [Tepidisphaeraceae bacterium]